MIQKIKDFVQLLNEKGIPLPLIRLDGKPTLTGTMTFISFNTALLGQIGKISGFLGGVDVSQSNYLFGICLAAYLGRKWQGNSSTKEITVEDSK